MASKMLTDMCEKGSAKMPGGSGKIQRSVSSMIKQMEMTDEELKYRMENFDNADIGKQYLKYLKCTRCNLNFQNIINKGKAVGVHPLLGVLLCDSCCDYYGDGNFSMDSEGEDKYCRWCGQGGTIFACSKCICGFCEECIKKHFGKHNLENVKNDDDWVCYFCNPRPLWYLRSICSLAKEAAKNKKECLQHLKDERISKKNRADDVPNSNSSDSCSSATGSIKQKQIKPKRFSKHRRKAKRDSSSSSDEIENVTILKKKRKDKKKSMELIPTEESSGSETRNPKKKAKLSDERNCDSDLETIRSPLLEKLKSIWKLTQTTTEVGLKSSRERLMNLSKVDNFNSMESLRREHEELKSCISVLVSTLGVASNFAESIGEDLKFDTAKDEREIFQSQESKLKRFAKRFEEQSDIETSFDIDRDAPSKVDSVEEKKKEKEEVKEKKKLKEKLVEKSAGGKDSEEAVGGGENGLVSGSQSDSVKEKGEKDHSAKENGKKDHSAKENGEKDHSAKENGEKDHSAKENGEKDHSAKENKEKDHLAKENGEKDHSAKENKEKDHSAKENKEKDHLAKEKGAKDHSAKEISPAKPLLKVKSFARMLDENVYDKGKKAVSVNGECTASEPSPIVIDLYDMDTEESECESQKKKEWVDGEKAKTGLSDIADKDSGKKSPPCSTPKKGENSSKRNEASHVEYEKCEDREQTVNSDQKEAKKSDVEKNQRKKRKKKNKRRKREKEKKKKEESSESGSEVDETDSGGARKKIQGADGKKGETSEVEAEKGTSFGDKNNKNCSSNGRDKRKDSENRDGGNSSERETVRTGKRLPNEKSPEMNARSDSASDGDSSGAGKKPRRVTRSKKKEKEELKATFAMFKEKRERFLRSGKANSQSRSEGEKVNALDSSDSGGGRKGKSGKQKKRVLTSSEEESWEQTRESGGSNEEGSGEEKQKSDSDVKSPSWEETSSDEMTSRQAKWTRLQKKRGSQSSEKETKSKRKRMENNSESSGEDSRKKIKGRKNIKKILKKDSLQVETKEALKNEEERRKRLQERQKLFEEAFPQQQDFAHLKHLVLDFDPHTKKPLVTVHKKLVKKLKPHQAKGVKFMWDNCFESVQRMEEDSGSGCILAHCMGLGKTLQVITLVHTVMTHDLGLNSVLIVCPLSTVSNWLREFEMWLADVHTDPIALYDILKYKRMEDRQFYVRDWQQSGGVLVTSYDLFRNLTKGLEKKKKSQTQRAFESAFLDPGPDLVICDEGHLLKNEGTALSKCMSRVKTSRRIVLTGTPLQNNLIEYHCMVQFVKPNILGTKKEFCNRFVNPISNGQFEDSTELDVKIMKRRSHVLHSMLDGCIQRFDYSVLTPFLPEKREYVLSIELTDTQVKAYKHFISHLSAKSSGSSRTASLFNDYHSLQKIWTHPRTLLMQSEKESSREEADSEGSLKDFVVSSEEESGSSKSESSCSSAEEVVPTRRITRSNANDPEVLKAADKEDSATKKNWWDEFYGERAFDDLRESNKLVLLFALLKHCKKIKDKVLVFSQSLYSLDLIEYFLNRITVNRDKNNQQLCGHQDTWVLGCDYFRLDGSTNSEKRSNWCNYFNKESNTRARLFLLSTKAGGLGINLYGANRVVIFDASWNPSHDLQSIFRVYRFGQKKTCYVYRFLSEATMEEKIYERQVTKLSLAHRVVDEHQIERHYTMGNLQALYDFNPAPREGRKVPMLPKDPVLADLLAAHKELIVGYHEHDSLLENKREEELSEEERKAAWKEYEEEKAKKTYGLDPAAQQQMLLLMQQARLSQGVRTAQELTSKYLQPANAGQTLINPMFLQISPNIPLAIHQRGMKVGLIPAANESLDSYFMRILNKESWMLLRGQQ